MQLFFEEGGIVMWPTAVFGFLFVASAVLGVRAGARHRATVVLGLLTLSSGALGATVGLINTMRWVTKAPAAEQLVGGATGLAESLNNLVLAFLLVIIALLVSAVGELRRPAPAR
ncbi:MAG: hypothetical protein INH41_02465 [Myxococcaceae bacterium]|jgi:hypothetical protein|nr:hypothetical protein [Myxococcaceae bacterium]MCA3011243.1 hypothetical protein [Myxococcaceae bacterium]